MRNKKPSRPRWSWFAAGAVLAVGSLLISPAVGVGDFNLSDAARKYIFKNFYTKDEIRIGFTLKTTARKHYKKFAKKKNTYTKLEVYSKGEVDQKFLPSSAPNTLSVNPSSWVAESSATPVTHLDTLAQLSTTGQSDFQAAMAVPARLQGKSLQVDSLELCYDATTSGSLYAVELRTVEQSPANPTGQPGTAVIGDVTVRDDEACRTYQTIGDVPVPIGPTDIVMVTVRISNGTVLVGRLTLNLTT